MVAVTRSRRLTPVLALASTAGCGGDDGAPGIDAATDAASTDGPPGAIDAGTDATGACILPTTQITCTVGNNAPCVAVCGTAYCRTFMAFGSICTEPCTGVGNCPAGWSCTAMGWCRPPG